jgi:hypothetical protein
MPGKPYQSKLIPYENEIRRLRMEDRPYREIAAYLRETFGVEAHPTTIFNFVKVRSRPRKVKYRMM